MRYRQAVAHEPASSIWSVNGSHILLVEDDEDIGSELIQALLVIENLIWSWTWGYQGILSVNNLDRHFAT